MGEFLDTVKKYLGNGRWMWVLVVAVLLVVIGISGALLWPVIRPKPEPQFMKVPASATATQTQTPAALPPVSEDVKEQIAAELGASSVAAVSMSYTKDTSHISVTEAVGANDFKTYLFVKGEDGSWSRQ